MVGLGFLAVLVDCDGNDECDGDYDDDCDDDG